MATDYPVLTAEMTLYWRSQGRSLLDRLDELYAEFGFHEEKGISKYFEGPSGMLIMTGIMEGYRKSQPKTIGSLKVVQIRDLGIQESWAPSSSLREKIDLPVSDVLQWRLEDGTLVTVRPSGTEPKIKFYILCRTEVGTGGLGTARLRSRDKIAAIGADLRKAIG